MSLESTTFSLLKNDGTNREEITVLIMKRPESHAITSNLSYIVDQERTLRLFAGRRRTLSRETTSQRAHRHKQNAEKIFLSKPESAFTQLTLRKNAGRRRSQPSIATKQIGDATADEGRRVRLCPVPFISRGGKVCRGYEKTATKSVSPCRVSAVRCV